ncbi:MAG: arylsulfatase [Planctomycetes bacterium]|nr:arylsulfatase [Planctomycetota bacterium]
MIRSLSRRGFLKSASAGLAAVTLAERTGLRSRVEAGEPAGKPNIIFILADDLGYGDLGCYGQKQIQTPNLDRLAAEGMRFTDHYAGTTVCAPSRCSLMTGLHTGHTYVRGNHEVQPMGQLPLPLDTATLPKVLRKAGYTTALIGKWGLGGPDSTGTPNRQGFDYFFGYLCQRHAHNYYPEFLFRNDQRILLKNKVAGGRPDGAGVATEKVEYSYDLMEREALRFVEQNWKGSFFLYLAVTLPHANNEGGKNGMEVPDYGIYADKDWPEPDKGRAAMISRLDRGVGRVMQKLKELGIDNNTLVFFASDNGPHREGGANPEFFHSSGPFRGIKRDLYEGGIRVPLLARWPGRIKAGVVSDHVSAFWDFLPTLAELAGAPCPAGTDGISLLPTLLGRSEQQRQHDFLYWEFHEGGSAQAVRMGRWKAVRPFGQRLELYDLQTDNGEAHDIADQHPDVVARIEKYLTTARTESKFWPLKGGKA